MDVGRARSFPVDLTGTGVCVVAAVGADGGVPVGMASALGGAL